MKVTKLSIGVLFLISSSTVFYAQTDKDTVKAEKNIEGVVLQGTVSKKTESAILIEQKKAVIQKQAVSSEEISRKGISNVEQGLLKVTGITAVEGRGLFVRGLEERYNTLLINGLGSPSNNPFQKMIALKQFPTDVVGKLNIYKTFNSNLYADFAGATFDIETAIYDKAFSKIDFSVGFNTQNTFRKNFKIAENANTMEGYIGLNSKNRQLPNEVDGYRPSGYSFSAAQSLNSFKDSWNVDNVKSLPNTGIGFTSGKKFKVGETGNIGMLLSLNHSSEYQYQEGNKNNFNEAGEYRNKLLRKKYTYELESSALLGLNYKNKGTNINLNGVFLQNSANMIDDYRGYRNQEKNDQFFRTNQQDISRFTNLQLFASQKINDRHSVKFGGSWINNMYQQPDRKIFFGNMVDENRLQMSFGGNNIIRQYLDMSGKNYLSALGEYTVALGTKNDKNEYPWLVSVGYNGFFDRRNSSYRFIYGRIPSGNNTPVTIDIDQPQNVFNTAINDGLYTYYEGSTAVYKSNLYQFVNAGYINLNYKPNEKWDILVGGRVENNINITRWKPLSASVNDNFESITKNQYYVLPSLAIKNTLNAKSNIRFAASKTITRPILIEYFPIEYINPDNENIQGNYDFYNATFDEKGLLNSENLNLDLKYEFFPTNKELFSVNIFGKKLNKAIERSYMPSGNSNGTVITFYNADFALLYGIELEGMINLGRISENLNQFSFGANATFMYSNIERSALQQNETDMEAGRKRALQGAAPWSLNADLKYETKNSENFTTTASLVYNVSGKKIYAVGFAKLDNVYEMPFHQLDFIISKQWSKQWTTKLSVLNILNSEYQLNMGENSLIQINEASLRMTDYRRGTSFNFNVGYTF